MNECVVTIVALDDNDKLYMDTRGSVVANCV